MKSNVIDITKNIINIDENCTYVFLFVGRNNESMSLDIEFLHELPNVSSNIRIKAILFDNAKFDFSGKLIVQKGAKGVDSYLKVDVLLMSEKVAANVIPSLEVKEDEVKAGHGASVGPVNREELFYLQSRGLDIDKAKMLIAHGFAQELLNGLDSVTSEKISEEINKLETN